MSNEPETSAESATGLSQQTGAWGVAFPNTQWSMVLKARQADQGAAAALNELCRRYWYPIYGYLRCRRFSREDAQDITQSFFMKAVSGGMILNAEREKGKLRTYLLAAMGRHLADHLRHQNAEKRGGRAMVLPMECYLAEDRFSQEPADTGANPDKLYDQAWARELLQRVRGKLRAYYQDSQRGDWFALLEPYLDAEEGGFPYRDLAARLGQSESNLRVQVHRVRQRFATMLREEVALTVQSPDELEEEMTWLGEVLRNG